MSKLVGSELPEDLYRKLSGRELDAHAEKAILVTTVDDRGWPHAAMLSYLEVAAKDRHNIRLAIYNGSTTTGNMRRTGRVTLLLFDERMVYYVKGTAEELNRAMDCSPYNSKINVRVEQVLADDPDPQFEPGVYVSTGVTYKDPNMAERRLKANALLKELLE